MLNTRRPALKVNRGPATIMLPSQPASRKRHAAEEQDMREALVPRKAGTGDVEALARLFDAYRCFYRQPSDPGLARRFVGERLGNGDSIMLVCELDRSLAGFCQLYPSFCSIAAARIHLLYDLFVEPDARRRGVARALMLAARAVARDSGAVRMELQTATSNLPAQALYESLGWVRNDEFQTYSVVP
jgi:ribosomal protein S18 acetylase RimI-like enzyme